MAHTPTSASGNQLHPGTAPAAPLKSPNDFRRTKIICTLGPASESPEVLRQLALAGANLFRLNMTHATHPWVQTVVHSIRRVAVELDLQLGILMDLKGPGVRTGDLQENLPIHPGDTFDFTVRGAVSRSPRSVSINYDGLYDDLREGQRILVDNGVLSFRLLEKLPPGILRCEVLTEGVLRSRRQVNLPGVRVALPALTDKDFSDIALAGKTGVDYVALSFTRQSADVLALRAALEEVGLPARIVAKIESQEAIANLVEIIRAADAVMVARGDLGIECPMEEIPILQRRIVKRAIQYNRQVVVATHMLESMIEHPHPTRAEVTDVANAVYEQADAIMLSGETAVGLYPVDCVNALDRIARRIERSGGVGFGNEVILESTRHKTVHSAVVLANSLANAKVLVFTRTGTIPGFVSTQRPVRAPIFAFSDSLEICRRLLLNWGVQPFLLDLSPDPAVTVTEAIKLLHQQGHVQTGDPLIVVSSMLSGEVVADAIQLRHA